MHDWRQYNRFKYTYLFVSDKFFQKNAYFWYEKNYWFLAHLTRRHKWTPLIRICPLFVLVVDIVVVVLVVGVIVVVVVNCSHFHLLLQNHRVNFNQKFCPFPRGDNNEIGKIHWRNLNKSASQEPLQFQSNLAQSILGWRGFKFHQMKGPALFQGEIITK